MYGSLTAWLAAQEAAGKEPAARNVCYLTLSGVSMKIQRAQPRTVQAVRMFLEGKSIPEIAVAVNLPEHRVCRAIGTVGDSTLRQRALLFQQAERRAGR